MPCMLPGYVVIDNDKLLTISQSVKLNSNKPIKVINIQNIANQ